MISSFFTVPEVLTSKECQEIINYCTCKCKQSDVSISGDKLSMRKDIRNSLNTFIAPDELPKTIVDFKKKMYVELLEILKDFID